MHIPDFGAVAANVGLIAAYCWGISRPDLFPTTATAALLWLISMAYHGRLLDATPAAFQGALTMALYPFLTWVFARTQHAVLRQA